MSRRLVHSHRYLERALRVIPWASQTGAKRYPLDKRQYMPAAFGRGKGCRLWDIDGNEYIDFRAALGPVILGYADPRVDTAVKAQIDRGVLFSMAGEIELAAAELVRDVVPCAEKVRFAKTGGEANSACIRLARVHTGRDVVLSTGYHGWQDYLNPGPDVPGVPGVVNQVAEKVPYLDVEAMRKAFGRHENRVAAVLTAPFNFWEEPDGARRYCQELRELTAENGAILVFDEVLTGFRLGIGGSQERFGVVPDLAVFAKAIANGYPLACFCGRGDVMDALDRTVFTATHNGETVSLAAGIATIQSLRDGAVYRRIQAVGRQLKAGLEELIAEHSLELRVSGIDEAPVVHWGELNRYYPAYEREMLLGGVFCNLPFFMMDAHTAQDISQTLEICGRAFAAVRAALDA